MASKFSLPELARVVWRSPEERLWWQAKIARIRTAWNEIERESVAVGLRPAAYQQVDANDLPARTAWAVHNGLTLLPVTQVSAGTAYQARTRKPETGQPWKYRVLLAQPTVAAEAFEAALAEDNERLGAVLGYPACCREAFARTWGQGQQDSIWEAYQEEPEGPQETNLFLRTIGARLVPHMPCRAACQASEDLGVQLAELGRRLGHVEAVDDLYDILSWPLEWTRIHGLTEITTPVLKIVSTGDYTPTLQRLVRSGIYIPATARLWTENGFGQPSGMLAVHSALLTACRPLLHPGDRVVDPGAGNGRLLALLRHYLGIIPLGIEKQPIEPIEAMDWMSTDLADPSVLGVYAAADSILLMPGRISELEPSAGERVRKACLQAKQLIVYGYKDNLSRAGGLEALTIGAGLPAPALLLESEQVAIGLIRPSGA